MKTTKLILFALILFIGQFSFHAYAVNEIKTVGATGSDYTTLKLAFDAINAGTLTGDIQLQIKDNTTETVAAILYQSGYGGVSNYSTVKIYPIVTGKTISGNINKILIVLSGVNNVTFDGRLHNSSGVLTGSARDLTIVNTFGDPGAVTIQLTINASNNVIKYCKVNGRGASSSWGSITLNAPTTASATGCANNTISNNIFSGTGGFRPWTVIYSGGMSGAVNTGNIVQDNDFENCYVNTSSVSCVSIHTFNNAWTISGNSFYETTNYTPAVQNSAYNFIYIGSGNSHTVSNNYIGGTATQCGGGLFTKTSSANNTFRGIYFTHADAGTTSTIENNVIKNFAWSNGTTNAPWTGISITGSHDVNIIGNTIGNVSVTNSTAGGQNVIGIEKTNGSATQRDIRNNLIYGLSLSAATTGQIQGIRITGGSNTISNNIISLSTDNAIMICGILDQVAAGRTSQWYFNTVRIGGSPTSGALQSWGFWSQTSTNVRDFRNNIFVNTRSNSGTASGSHYAAFFNYSVNTNLTFDYNNYFVSGTGGVLGRYAGADKTSLPIVTDKDAASMSVNPVFDNPTGTAAIDLKPTATTLVGVAGTGITTDYSGAARNIPTIGAWEVAPSVDLPTLAATVAATSITTSTASSGGEVTAIGTSAVTARGVCWSTSTLPTVALSTKTTDGSGIGSFTSSITGLASGVTYYVRAYATNSTGTAYGEEISFTTLDEEIPTAFTATKGAVGFTTVELLLNATDNSGSIAYTISYGAGPTVVNTTGTSGVQKSQIITGLLEATAYTFSVVAKDAAGNEAANSPIIVAATTLSTVPLVAAPTPPTRAAGNVRSVFSDAYTPIAGTTVFNPNWGQNTTVTNISVEGNTTMKYSTFNYQGTNLGSDLNLTTLGMTHIHFDVWSPDETLIRFSLIQRTPQSERPVNSTITPGTWNSIDIPISDFTSQSSFLVSAIYQLKMEGAGWYPTNTGTRTTVYLDNIYFYKAVPGEPTNVVSTPGSGQASVAFTAPENTGGSAITGYTVTSSPGGLTATGASSPLVVAGLTNGVAYTFTVTATNAQGTGAASAASTEVTPHATSNIIEVSSNLSTSGLTLTQVSDLKVISGATLTVNDTKTVNSITVESGGKLNVSSGSPLNVGTLTFKAIKDASSFSSKIEDGITATTVRLFKIVDATKWYFLSFPCNVNVADIRKSDGESLGVIGTDWFIKYYDGHKRSVDGVLNGSNWVSVTEGALTAKKGYIFGLKTGTPETEVLFPLNTSVLAAETESTVPVLSYSEGGAGSVHLGWNLIGQPYLSRYNANTNPSAPSFMVMPNSNGRTYTVTSKVASSLPEVNPFAAYFVQSPSNGNISFALSSRQNAPSVVVNDVSDNVKLNVVTTTGSDYTYLIMDNEQTTDYQIGQDMVKWIGIDTDIPQIYTVLNDIKYAFNALPLNNVVNLPLGLYTKTSGLTTISVDFSQAPGLSKLLLTDRNTSITTDLMLSDYSFTADAGTDDSRFVVTAQRVSTDINLIDSEVGEPKLVINNSKLIISDINGVTSIRVYDANGRLFANTTTDNNSMEISLAVHGLYLVKIESGTNSWVKKVVNRK
jgi:hypothetical protein